MPWRAAVVVLMVLFWLSVWAARYVTGRPLDGQPRTDSRFLTAGTRAVTETGHASRWAYLPGWQRALWRDVPLLIITSGIVGYHANPLATTLIGSAILAGGMAETGRRLRRKWLRYKHISTYVVPLHGVLSSAVGGAKGHWSQMLDIPVDFHTEGVESRITLPSVHLTAELKRTIRDIVVAKLGIRDPDIVWHTIGQVQSMTFRPAPAPPRSAPWAGMVAEAARKAPDTAPVLGFGPRGTIVDVNLVDDSPHILVSAGAGGGKSVLVRTLIAQGLNRGGGVVFLDLKRHSHVWAIGLPGVVYARDIAEIHDALVALGEEGDRRNRASDATGEYSGHRIWIACEEMNATIFKLAAYWEEIREKTDPKTSPAIAALRDILFMGRAVKMNVIAIAQMMTARTIGGPEARENFATRCLTRCTANALKMLVPEVLPVKRPKGLGRWLIVKNGEAFETQVAMMSTEEARAWATGGVANPGTVLTSHSARGQANQAGTVLVELPTEAAPAEELIGLRASLSRLPGPAISLDAIRKAAQRRPSSRFPESVGQDGPEALYRLSDLITWKTRRDAIHVVDGRTSNAA